MDVLDSLSLSAVYHAYESQRLSTDYGSEIDLQLQAKRERVTGLLKYASYHANRLATDTRKFWAQIEYVW